MDEINPWYWRSQPLQKRSGTDIFSALFANQPIATLLESPYPHPQGQYSICAGGPRSQGGESHLWTPELGQILPFLERLAQNRTPLSQADIPDDLPFQGGWLGWLGYDLAWEIERLPYLNPDPLPFPIAFWYEPENFAVLDHNQQTLWLATTHIHQLDHLQQQLTSHTLQTQTSAQAFKSANFQFWTNQVAYEAMVRKALAHIKAGDIFQANLSTRFSVTANIDPWQLYQQLQTINPSPFASYWQTPWGSVVSCSPERLVRLKERKAETRPIAGTRARGSTPKDDQTLAQDLRENIKEQAEHTMLVDLERNDLGRVCTRGSVAVDEFLALEYYSHVIHLVSNIIGTLQPTCSVVDLIRSVFPGGTITGCPKVRCMEIIETLEPYRRSLFYGSCGYLDYRGHLDLNILIRTLLVKPVLPISSPLDSTIKSSMIWGQVGAGIVADSDPKQEWLESLQKAKAQVKAIQNLIR